MIETRTLISQIVEGMQEKKAKNIAIVDMSALEAPCPYFVICQGNSPTQIQAIAESVKDWVRKNCGEKPLAQDGLDNCLWVAMDYIQAIVHIFQPEARQFYDIEHLWADAKITYIPDLD